jgi:hypothetical protein
MTLSINGQLPIALCLALLPGCSDSQPANAGSGGVSSSAGSSSAGSNSAGASATGGTPAGGAGGSSGRAGSAGSVTAGGGTGGTSVPSAGAAGLGGASGAASGGGGVAGAFGGSGASGSSGMGAASGGPGLLTLASGFDQFRFECPCIDANHFGPSKGENCDNAATADRQTHSKKLAGDASIVYDVKLRVRGNTEPNTYVLGKLDPNKRFYVGGETSTPGYTAYMLTVADPKQVYFFNYNPSTSHIHFLIDYEVTIPMRGGTTLTFEVNGGKSVPDGHGVSNHDRLVVPGIPPAPDPYNGQLVQFDVVSVQPRP